MKCLDELSYHMNHIHLFCQSKVYGLNNKGYAIDIWNFTIQNNLFFYSFIYIGGWHMNKEFVVGRTLQKAFKALPSSTFVLKYCFILCLWLKKARFFFKFKYLFHIFSVSFKKLFQITGPRAWMQYMA